ncbi:MAG: hypothetical protein K5846_07385 [Bacteroidales bacterium]|nr:hypothetical protein [Bacteroidales bacterium]
MKPRKILFAILLGFVALFCTSCYPESTKINPEYRIVNAWKVVHVYLNGETIEDADLQANRPGVYYNMYADHILTVMLYYNGQVRESTFSTWVLQDKNTQLALDFTILGHHYEYVAKVMKLTKKELILEYDDENHNHWRLVLNGQASF